ncbi:MAG: tyrosine-type recombinase/integrase [Nitrospina sp.]|jgi:site-specific recombinase XerD|nr:tyrosine-type recombinase/integrase [Nitrospina sp.]
MEKKQTRLEKRRSMYLGIYNQFILPSGKPTTRDLISKDSLEWDMSGTRRRRRTQINQGMLLKKLWTEMLKVLEEGEVLENTNFARKIIQKYLDSVSTRVCPSTVKQYTACLNHFILALGDFDLDNPPNDVGETFLRYLDQRSMTDTSKNSNVRQVQSFFIWCEEKGYSQKVIKLSKKKPTKKIPIRFTESEMDRLLELIENHIEDAGENKNKLISALNQKRAFYLFRYTGVRAGEVRTLPLKRMSNFNPSMLDSDGKHQFLIADVPELDFRVKGKHEAFVPIAKNELLEFLHNDLAERGPDEKWYLDNGEGEPQWNSVQTFGRVFDSNLRKLGIKGKRTHGFRATVISNLLDAGTPAVSVQMLVRHKELATTLGYFNPNNAELRKHIEANL